MIDILDSQKDGGEGKRREEGAKKAKMSQEVKPRTCSQLPLFLCIFAFLTFRIFHIFLRVFSSFHIMFTQFSHLIHIFHFFHLSFFTYFYLFHTHLPTHNFHMFHTCFTYVSHGFSILLHISFIISEFFSFV